MREQILPTERHLRITVLQHRITDLLMAVSYDLPGLMVPGRSEEELNVKLPAAIQELLEAEGHQVLSVEIVEKGWDLPADFLPPPHIADALIRLAH